MYLKYFFFSFILVLDQIRGFECFSKKRIPIAVDEVAAAAAAEVAEAGSRSRTKRSFIRFGLLIRCVTKSYDVLKWNDYGCYCGFGGGGRTVDRIDKCCRVHDECYGKVKVSFWCRLVDPTIMPYDYTCKRRRVRCKDAAGSCARQACDCDRKAAICLNKHKRKYNPDHKDYDQDLCWL